MYYAAVLTTTDIAGVVMERGLKLLAMLSFNMTVPGHVLSA